MTFETIIHFGRGKLKGTRNSGFHQLNNTSVFTGILWRGDSRPPDIVFSSGFQRNRSGVTISGRTTSSILGISPEAGTTRGGISLSKSIAPCAIWAQSAARHQHKSMGWLYLISIENDPMVAEVMWHVRDSNFHAGRAAAAYQEEFLMLAVDSTRICAARAIDVSTGNLVGSVIRNPAYHGPDLFAHAANDWGIRKFQGAENTVINPASNPAELREYGAYLDGL